MEQEIPGDPKKNRPDPGVINETAKKITVVDVTIPFEGEDGSLLLARRAKETKYAALKTWLQGQYKEVNLEASVVGYLGSWTPDNEKVLRIRRNYLRLFCRLCCISFIVGSRKIWQAFCPPEHGHMSFCLVK